MLSRLTILSTISVVALTACATNQENPHYKYSSKYKGAPVTTVAQAPTVIQSAPVSYETANYENAQQASYTRVNHECLKKEKNHELLGAGLGGTIGAIAGKKLIGGTKGTVIGAGLGGAAGYGIGDKTVNCDPETYVMQQSQPVVSTAYVAPTQAAIAQPASTIATTTDYVSPTDTEFNSISGTGTPGYQALQAQIGEIYKTPLQNNGTASYGSSAQEVSYDYTANIVETSAATTAIPSETRILGGSAYSTHLVKDGDTVYSLSRKLCVGVSDIQSLNGLNANYGINIGDQLQLPASNC